MLGLRVALGFDGRALLPQLARRDLVAFGKRHLARMASSIADPTQRKLMEEQCILVDADDKVVGQASKLDCHRRVNIEASGMLHRAFSVFLFNTKGELLLQERADCKVTFPGYVTNTCCSHPLYLMDELVNEPLAMGVKRAAQRRVNYELGVPIEQVNVHVMSVPHVCMCIKGTNNFHFMSEHQAEHHQFDTVRRDRSILGLNALMSQEKHTSVCIIDDFGTVNGMPCMSFAIFDIQPVFKKIKNCGE